MAVVLNKKALTDADILRVIALSGLELPDDDRAKIKPGSYKINETFAAEIKGEIRVGADGTQEIVAKADAWGLLALALNKLNTVTVDHLLKEYFDGAAKAAAAELKKRTAKAIRKLKGATKSKVRGKVTKDLEVRWA